MIVLDASAAVELVLRTPSGDRISRRIQDDGGPCLAPHLIDPEFVQALRELLRRREITLHRAEGALASFGSFPLHRIPHDVLRARMWELRDNVTAYDAAYVVLAELRRCPLLTCDHRLAKAPATHRAVIESF